MAVVDLTSQFPRVVEASSVQVEQGSVRVGVHDASRVEWSLSVPLPEGAPLQYSIHVEMSIPALVRQSPWEQLQSFTRLDGPALSAVRADAPTIDALRRAAVAIANKLSRASDGFSRHCRLCATPLAGPPGDEVRETMLVWIEAAIRMTDDVRKRFATGCEADAPEITRERALLDEYASVRLLEMLASAERALGKLACARGCDPAFAEIVNDVEARVADALETELLHRKEAHFLATDPKKPEGLELYIDRASRLKKHFQEVLFLESETFQVAERIHHWVAALAALLASTWAFAWQLALVNRKVSTGSTVGSGLLLLAVVAGIIYATKDRLKEMGRTWVSGKVHRVLGAQRIARYRAPAKRLPGRDVIVIARESFNQTVEQLPDALNPESGATTSATILRYSHKGRVLPQATLREAGVRRVKHVFRYDMSPLFARLDDAHKSIPVLDEQTHRVSFIDAPRFYRVPMKLKVSCGETSWEESATLVLHKRGLERIDREEREERAALDSDPALLDTALEPG